MYSRKEGFVLMIGDFKSLILGPRQLLKSSFKAFCFMLKVLLALEIFTFLFWLFGYVKKRLDKKVKFNSKIYDVTSWAPNNYNTHIAQYPKK